MSPLRRRAEPELLQPRQDFRGEIRELFEVVEEVDGHEEFARAGVDVVFVRAPRIETLEEVLLVQFQGMIAEYEKAQISERTRRGKRHHARCGVVNVARPTGIATSARPTASWRVDGR